MVCLMRLLNETETLSESSRVVCSNTRSIVFHVRLRQVQLHYKILFIICCRCFGVVGVVVVVVPSSFDLLLLLLRMRWGGGGAGW